MCKGTNKVNISAILDSNLNATAFNSEECAKDIKPYHININSVKSD